jgi:hypothetical protein
MLRKLIAAALAAGTLLLSPTTHAAPRAEVQPGWSVAGLLGLGFSNYYGFGIGGRGGYTLENHVYLGGILQYNFGWSSYASFYTGFEGGYDIPAGPLLVRPYGGLGPAWITYPSIYTGCGAQVIGGVVVTNGVCQSTATVSYFAFWFGGTAIYPINDLWFVGGDLRFFVIPGYGPEAISGGVMGTGGYQF